MKKNYIIEYGKDGKYFHTDDVLYSDNLKWYAMHRGNLAVWCGEMSASNDWKNFETLQQLFDSYSKWENVRLVKVNKNED